MVTEKSRNNGGNGIRFLGWLVIVLAAGFLLCDVAYAQPGQAGKKKEKKEDSGELGGLGAPAVVKKAPEPVEPDEPASAAAQPDQNYEEIPIDEGLKKNQNKVGPILMSGKFADGEKEIFDEYYQKYLLPRWTQVKDITSLPKFRGELDNQLRRKSAAPDAHEHLNALVLEFMQNLAAGPYHPAVQVNAMLMIGELNSIEQPPTPLPEALEVMIAAVANPKLSDAVRAAAMVGVERHVAAGIPDAEVRKALATSMLKLAADDLPAGSAEAGREWILAQAIDTLGRLGSVGENNAVFKMMAKKVSDTKLSFSTRSIAAESLGRLNYSGASGINPVETAALLGQFVVDACTEELRLAKESDKGISRRRMKRRLNVALVALFGGEDQSRKGVASLARDPAQQALLAALQKNIEILTAVLDDKKREADDLEAPVDELRTKLEAWLKKKPK